MKATGADIWDFYKNGFPTEYSHDTYDREIACWPDENSSRGAYSLLDDDIAYDLKDFGTLWDSVSDKMLTFEDAYLTWKGIEKPEPDTFYKWFARKYPGFLGYRTTNLQNQLKEAWMAAIASTKEN
jgi:hypothetical protein